MPLGRSGCPGRSRPRTAAAAITDYIDRALAQRDVGLADDQRRRAHHDHLHGHRSDQRHPLLLPGVRQQRRRQLSRSRNTANAIPRTVPTAVRSLTATPTNLSGRSRLAWTAPSSNGGAAITDYVIQRSTNGTSMADDQRRRAHHHRPHGHRSDQRHPLLLPSSRQERRGHRTIEQRRQPDPPHGAVRAATLTATPGSGRVVLTWTPPASTGGSPITRYVIQRSTSPTSGWVNLSTTTPATARSFTATGLRNGTRYYFRIAAVNAAGTGPWSAAVSAVPR